jgi:hypothetical protein
MLRTPTVATVAEAVATGWQRAPARPMLRKRTAAATPALAVGLVPAASEATTAVVTSAGALQQAAVAVTLQAAAGRQRAPARPMMRMVKAAADTRSYPAPRTSACCS